MRYFKHFLAVVAIIVIAVIPSLFTTDTSLHIISLIAGVLLVSQIITFGNRNNLNWKEFYTSPYNILTAKKSETYDFDISQELLFEKAAEVMKGSGLKVKKIDSTKKIILCTAPITFKSWGENVYVTVNKKDDNSSELIYESVAFQAYTWGKNEDNAADFKQKLEESFII